MNKYRFFIAQGFLILLVALLALVNIADGIITWNQYVHDLIMVIAVFGLINTGVMIYGVKIGEIK